MSRNELYGNVQETFSRINGLILALDDEQLSSQEIFALEIVLPGSPQLILSNHLQKKMHGSSLKSFQAFYHKPSCPRHHMPHGGYAY